MKKWMMISLGPLGCKDDTTSHSQGTVINNFHLMHFFYYSQITYPITIWNFFYVGRFTENLFNIKETRNFWSWLWLLCFYLHELSSYYSRTPSPSSSHDSQILSSVQVAVLPISFFHSPLVPNPTHGRAFCARWDQKVYDMPCVLGWTSARTLPSWKEGRHQDGIQVPCSCKPSLSLRCLHTRNEVKELGRNWSVFPCLSWWWLCRKCCGSCHVFVGRWDDDQVELISPHESSNAGKCSWWLYNQLCWKLDEQRMK